MGENINTVTAVSFGASAASATGWYLTNRILGVDKVLSQYQNVTKNSVFTAEKYLNKPQNFSELSKLINCCGDGDLKNQLKKLYNVAFFKNLGMKTLEKLEIITFKNKDEVLRTLNNCLPVYTLRSVKQSVFLSDEMKTHFMSFKNKYVKFIDRKDYIYEFVSNLGKTETSLKVVLASTEKHLNNINTEILSLPEFAALKKFRKVKS